MNSVRTAGRLERLVAWSERPAPPSHAYAIAALVGIVVNVCVFGFGHIFGTSAYWDMPHADARAHIMGYRYFLYEAWHWPPFVVHQMNVPYPKSIAFTDSIPLWAALNKAVATIVPPWKEVSARAYLGVWHLLMYVLQPCFGVANLRTLGKRSYAAATMTAVLFISVPAFVFRYEHASLTAQFLTLWALQLYLRSREGASPRLWATFVAQLTIAALINPYHVAISFALFVAALLETRSVRVVLVWILAGLGAIGGSAALAGFFASEAKVAMAGFDTSSSNVLSPFIPLRSVLFRHPQRLANVLSAEWQYEGFAYLGLGILVLLLLFVPRIRTLGGVIARHRVLFVVAFGMWLFSLSNHVYVGSHRILSYEWSDKLQWVTQQYRSPGRFVWLPMYVLIVFIWRWALDHFRHGWLRVALPLIVLTQFVDGGLAFWQRLSAKTTPRAAVEVGTPAEDRPPTDHVWSTYVHYLDLARWRPLIHAHQAIEAHPPYDCILDGTPFLDYASQEIEFLASEHAVPINGVYTARPTRNCFAEARLRETLSGRDGTLYVVFPQAFALIPQLEASGAECSRFAFGRVCSANAAAVADARRAGVIVDDLPAYEPHLALGERLHTGTKGDPSFLRRGWSFAEEGGRWTSEASAQLMFRFAGPLPTRATLNIEANAVVCGARNGSDIDVELNGEHLATLHFAETSNTTTLHSIPIPDATTLSHRVTLIELRPRDVRSPRQLGCNDDERKLGMWVRSLWIANE